MLQELRVKNLALIKEAELNFSRGLHVLTGETGAGKSLLLGSVGLALGEKAGADYVGHDDDSALSELIFSVEDKDVLEKLMELDLPEIEDGELILQRKLQGSRSSCRINGETFPASKLKAVAELLVDIHGQHENQSLLKKANHRLLLDGFAGDELSDLLIKLSAEFSVYQNIKRELTESSVDEMKKERDIALLQHEINEIRTADLKMGEDEECESAYRKMMNARKIMEAVSLAANLTGDETVANIGRALRELNSVTAFDEELSDSVSLLTDIDSLLSEFNHSLSSYISGLDFDQEDFVKTEQRLDEINQLKSRYGNTIEAINEYANKAEQELIKLQNFDEYLAGLKIKFKESRATVEALCTQASKLRQEAAATLSDFMEQALSELNFEKAVFEVSIDRMQEMTSKGFDDVEFMVSLNPGEPIKPLKDVASGGELSRIMLALRTAGALQDGIGTLIFDEIDAGISGRTAAKVAQKLSELSKTCQVICITHLPQIASFADHHYLIEKTSENDVTRTSITKLTKAQSLDELTRLLGDTEAARVNAAELVEQAERIKNE